MNSKDECSSSPQPFLSGFPGAAVLDRLCEKPLMTEAAPIGWRRASVHEDGGSSLRHGETAGMFAPDTNKPAPVVFGPRPGVTAKATAADRMSAPPTAADQKSKPHDADNQTRIYMMVVGEDCSRNVHGVTGIIPKDMEGKLFIRRESAEPSAAITSRMNVTYTFPVATAMGCGSALAILENVLV